MKTIVVVDDEAKIREVVVSYMQMEGFRTEEADTGAKALELVRGGKADLIILDLMLPDMSGEEVCKSKTRTRAVAFQFRGRNGSSSERSAIN